MRLLIVGLNYAPEQVGIGPYTADLARWMAAHGHAVSVIAGQPYYPEWRARPGRRGYQQSTEDGVRVIRCPHYVPRRPTGLRRILHHLSFALTALPAAWRQARTGAFDHVLFVAPALLSAPVALLAARRARAQAWLHVQDYELEAALATGLLSAGAIARLGHWVERRLLAGFATVSTISAPMMDKAAAKGVDPARIAELRNWAELDSVRPDIDGSSLRAELGVPAGPVALYSGNLAMKQGIGVLAEAARLLAPRSPVQFVVCGDGSGRDDFARAAAGLGNLHLRPLQPRNRLGELLAMADLHLLPQIAGAADLVLPSKLTNMLASGRPVIATADPGTALAHEVEGCGLVVPPGDGAALAHAVEAMLADADLRAASARNARARAEERWSRDAILARLEARLLGLAAGGAPHAPHPPLPSGAGHAVGPDLSAGSLHRSRSQ